MKTFNNFVLGHYVSPEYFCDREKETERLIEVIKNERNINLISHRRMGKTGLIFHVLHNISHNTDYKTIYIDLLNTKNLNEFVNEFATVSLENLESKTKKMLKQFASIVKGIRPAISINPYTGSPEMTVEVQKGYAPAMNIHELFQFLDSQNKRIVIAFDEFQQILNYPEDSVEAMLRKYIQQTKNISFIYSGSQKHLLTSMFTDYNRPFYQSAEFMFLDKIPEGEYSSFIISNFNKGKQKIDIEGVELILNLTKRHTYYVQFLCNRLFSLQKKTIDTALIYHTMNEILYENRAIYYTYEKILSKGQFELLRAISKEDNLTQPTSKDFIQNHKLSTPSSVKRALSSLLEKEMIFEDEGVYSVYDVFFSRYLESI
jgi:AAA+ ATPase superfamily predicted ATPase